MSIYFRNTPVSAPFMFESLGNHWNQDTGRTDTHTIIIFRQKKEPAASK